MSFLASMAMNFVDSKAIDTRAFKRFFDRVRVCAAE